MIIKSTVGKIDAAIGRIEGPLLAYMQKAARNYEENSLLKDLFGVHTSKSYQETVAGMTGISDWVQTDGPVPYDEFEEGFPKQFIHYVLQKGLPIKRELIDDDKILDIRKFAKAQIIDSYYRTREKFVHAKFNNPTTKTFALAGKEDWDNTGADGEALCSTNHKSKTGKADGQSNLTSYVLNSSNLKLVEDMAKNFKDENGERANINIDTILVPYELREVAWELTGTPNGYDSPNGNVNPKHNKYKVIVSPELTDVDAWFALDSVYMKDNNLWIDRVNMEVESQRDFNTKIWQLAGYARFSLGHVDYRWCVGNIPT